MVRRGSSKSPIGRPYAYTKNLTNPHPGNARLLHLNRGEDITAQLERDSIVVFRAFDPDLPAEI